MKKKFFRLHGITVAELENLKAPGKHLYTISKSYKDEEGNWKYTNFFTLRDLLTISAIIHKVADFNGDIKEGGEDEDNNFEAPSGEPEKVAEW